MLKLSGIYSTYREPEEKTFEIFQSKLGKDPVDFALSLNQYNFYQDAETASPLLIKEMMVSLEMPGLYTPQKNMDKLISMVSDVFTDKGWSVALKLDSDIRFAPDVTEEQKMQMAENLFNLTQNLHIWVLETNIPYFGGMARPRLQQVRCALVIEKLLLARAKKDPGYTTKHIVGRATVGTSREKFGNMIRVDGEIVKGDREPILFYGNRKLTLAYICGVRRTEKQNMEYLCEDYLEDGRSTFKMYVDAKRFIEVSTDDFNALKMAFMGQYISEEYIVPQDLMQISMPATSSQAKNETMMPENMTSPMSVAQYNDMSTNYNYEIKNKKECSLL